MLNLITMVMLRGDNRMKKIVINKSYGGFGLSLKAQKRLAELKGKEIYFYKQTKYNFRDGIEEYNIIKDLNIDDLYVYPLTKYFGERCNSLPNDSEAWFFSQNLKRDDKDLIKVVEELGSDVNGIYAKLKIVEIPNDVEWEVKEYHGMEWVAEKHRVWG